MSEFNFDEDKFGSVKYDPLSENIFARYLENKKTIRKHANRVGVGVLCFLAAPLVLSLGLGITGLYDFYFEDFSFQYCVEMILMVFFLFLPFLLIYCMGNKEEKETVLLSLEKPSFTGVFLLTIPFGLMLCIAGDYISSWISTLFEMVGITLTSVPDYDVPTSGGALFLFAFSTIVPPAIIEEFAMRCVTMQPLRKYGDKFAIVMTALVFGLMHRNAVQGIFAFIAGLVFGYIAVIADSVWPSVIVHALNNAFAVVINVMNETNPELANVVYMVVLSVVAVSGLLSTVLLVFATKKNFRMKNPTPKFPVKSKLSSFLLSIPMMISIIIMLIYTIFGDL